MEALQHLAHLYSTTDQEIRKGTREMSISCKARCDACCYFLITCSVPEALAAVLCATKSGFDMQRLPSLIKPQFAALMDLDMTLEQWARDHRACPFLTDHECSIYDYRPIPCRGQLVVSDAALCGLGSDVTVIQVNLKEHTTAIMAMHMPLIAQRLGLISSGFAPWPVALTVALAYLGHGPQAANMMLHKLQIDNETAASMRWAYLMNEYDKDEIDEDMRAAVEKVFPGMLRRHA